MEIGVIRAQTEYLKSATMLYVGYQQLVLDREYQIILAQRATKLQEVRFEHLFYCTQSSIIPNDASQCRECTTRRVLNNRWILIYQISLACTVRNNARAKG